jgi:hypothetical protein
MAHFAIAQPQGFDVLKSGVFTGVRYKLLEIKDELCYVFASSLLV